MKYNNKSKNWNKFEFILIASKRARDLQKKFVLSLIYNTPDKVTMTALKEIKLGLITKNYYFFKMKHSH